MHTRNHILLPNLKMAGLVRTSRALLEGIQGILEGGWAAHVPFCDMLPRREVRMLKDTGSTTQFACSSIPSKKRVCRERHSSIAVSHISSHRL